MTQITTTTKNANNHWGQVPDLADHQCLWGPPVPYGDNLYRHHCICWEMRPDGLLGKHCSKFIDTTDGKNELPKTPDPIHNLLQRATSNYGRYRSRLSRNITIVNEDSKARELLTYIYDAGVIYVG